MACVCRCNRFPATSPISAENCAMTDENDSQRPMHSDPDKEAIDEPTTSGAQEADETAWMMKEGVTIGLISIALVLVLALGLLQATGSAIDIFGLFIESALGQWLVVGVLALAVLTAFVWSRVGV
ncbi:hypothetical protein BDK88_1759 [Natrinema hispanicum]|uniref:Uncharacterized protein n=2 Tax=Natrinema hispanicum TaxID=392421 RepID=A0A482YCN8_9EURY|nr:hypothetical protein BDK88_1759 [Natrinema hispanicum]